MTTNTLEALAQRWEDDGDDYVANCAKELREAIAAATPTQDETERCRYCDAPTDFPSCGQCGGPHNPLVACTGPDTAPPTPEQPDTDTDANEAARKLLVSLVNASQPIIATAFASALTAAADKERERILGELDRLMVEARKPTWLSTHLDDDDSDVGAYVYERGEPMDAAVLVNTLLDAQIAGLQVFVSTPRGTDTEDNHG